MDIMCPLQEYDIVKQVNKPKWIPFLQLKRDYQCTMCCCNRPVIYVDDVTGKEATRLGSVKDVWSACGYAFELFTSADDRPIFRVTASCCQCGFHCHFPCGPCKEITMEIIDLRSDTRRGLIKKVVRSPTV